MKYLDFREKLSSFMVFSQTDIFKYFPNFNAVQLTRWQEQGYIRKIIKGYYIFADLEVDEKAMSKIAD